MVVFCIMYYMYCVILEGGGVKGIAHVGAINDIDLVTLLCQNMGQSN